MLVLWDPKKAEQNLKKHKISFEEAQTVLESNRQLILQDFKSNEERFVAIGFSAHLKLLVVVYCYRFHDVLRIISARKATRNERQMYEERI
jgi:uncharacterized DUF497 family protein